MSGNRLDFLTEKFLEGELDRGEEQELRERLLKVPQHHLNTYFKWIDQTNAETSDFINTQQTLSFSRKRLKTRVLRYAAAITIICVAGYVTLTGLKQNQKDVITDFELDQAYSQSLQAVSAISGLLNEGMDDMYSELDFSTPFKDFKQLNETTKEILNYEKNDN
ncbi:hypothetical protein BFP97_03720 [Roseivirga sp. 4D4]|uniref:hypothetical protein n=1 Tax=Roseivirga sp. 4D4 TaxID=1889784 RepID=UPI0008538612|nr:hypothetical protein [Roseivirga sp. 4D4]OEK00667.1 hypothetical protein BFP97_03720 [Roseivirga sp. 4D4]